MHRQIRAVQEIIEIYGKKRFTLIFLQSTIFWRSWRLPWGCPIEFIPDIEREHQVVTSLCFQFLVKQLDLLGCISNSAMTHLAKELNCRSAFIKNVYRVCSVESRLGFSLLRLINGSQKQLDACLELELLRPVTAKVAFSKGELQFNKMEMLFNITDTMS